MMRHFAPLLLLLGLVGCSTTYSSPKQAENACAEWESQKVIIGYEAEQVNKTYGSRWCQQNKKENEFLGYKNHKMEDGTWKNKEGKEGRFQIVKRFRY